MIRTFLDSASDHHLARYMLNKIMIPLHAAPKTQPGGVQGALCRCKYQLETTPEPVKKLPSPSAA